MDGTRMVPIRSGDGELNRASIRAKVSPKPCFPSIGQNHLPSVTPLPGLGESQPRPFAGLRLCSVFKNRAQTENGRTAAGPPEVKV